MRRKTETRRTYSSVGFGKFRPHEVRISSSKQRTKNVSSSESDENQSNLQRAVVVSERGRGISELVDRRVEGINLRSSSELGERRGKGQTQI